jgi:hypothetical protein
MVGMFAATTMAADWAFYGSARMGTYWVTEDKKGDEEGDLAWAEQGNARFGARAKVSDTLSGRMEFGVSDNVASQRLLYADWNFGAGVMRIGQAYAPGNIFISNQVYGADNNNLNYGGFYTGRQEEISVKFAKMFEIALIKPTLGYETGLADDINDPLAADDSALGAINVDTTLPKIEAAVTYGQENWWVQGSLGYQTYTIKDQLTIADGPLAGTHNFDITVDSLVYGIGGMFNMAGFYVGGVFMGGTNIGTYGLYAATANTPGIKNTTVNSTGGLDFKDTEDTTSMGFNLVLGYNINDMLKVEGGYGWIESDNSDYDKADADQSYYVQLPITLAPGVTITPEFGVQDGMKDADDADEGSDTYFGAKWQMNF